MLFQGHSAHQIFTSVSNSTRLVFSRSRRRERKTQRKIPNPVEKAVVIDVETFLCKSLSTEVQFPIPRIPQNPKASVPAQESTQSLDLLAAHTKYTYEAQPWLELVPRNTKQPAKELETIRFFFPGIDDDSVILSMTAWFSALCSVDDLVEDMDPTMARRVLQNARNTILKNAETSLGGETGELVTGLGVEKADRGDVVDQNTSSEFKVEHILRTLVAHVKNLLPATICTAFLEDVRKVIAGMMAEMLFQESPPSLDSYMKIRSRTIGIAPFITLAEGHLKISFIDDRNSTLRQKLKDQLSEIIGLQNDLIGLDKDLRTRCPMNAVVVMEALRKKLLDTESEKDLILRESLKEVEKIHAEAVERAIEIWKAIHRVATAGQDKELSNIMMALIERHLKWSMACQRYKTGGP